MTHEEQHIETIFKKAFENHEVQPPGSLWGEVEASLNESKNVDALYATTFKYARVAPPASLWSKIAHTLFWRSFLNFNFNTFNVYYVAAALSVVSVGLYNAFPPQQRSAQPLVAAQEIVAQEQETQPYTAPAQSVAAQTQAQQSTAHKETNIQTAAHTVKPEKTQTASTTPHSAGTEKTTAGEFNFAAVHIVGSNSVCANSATEYSIEGLPAQAIIDWNLPQGAQSKFISTRTIAAQFAKEGNFTLGATVKVGGTSKKLELPIRVEEARKPEIKGRRDVCEGSEKEPYSVEESINKEITYVWESQRNTVHATGNKYVSISWKNAGKDTLSVTRINLVTGCSAVNSAVINVLPAPKVDFAMSAISANEYELWFVGDSKKIQSFTWFIDGAKHSGESLVHSDASAQSSVVKLEITDKAGCKNSIQRDVTFGRNIVFVPKTFTISETGGFIPQTNSRLRSYHIEIYNARSEKIWESTELQDGKPAKAWNGMYKNAPAGTGKYMWRIAAVFEDGSTWYGVRQKDGKIQPSGIFTVER
ncbi:MAG: hypothetical protein LBU90_03395 [Bacteroidales bacterium]|jgi:hypothetical protein|nr:hypothetical protein [Bacteroidales bacterium]